jgi:hypothetical protein
LGDGIGDPQAVQKAESSGSCAPHFGHSILEPPYNYLGSFRIFEIKDRNSAVMTDYTFIIADNFRITTFSPVFNE